MKKALFSWFSFLLILLWMTSCVSRKSQTSHTDKKVALEQTITDKKDLTVQDNSNVKVTNEVTSTDETTTSKKNYTPIDPTKPSTFTDDNGNKKELNNASFTEEKTTTKSNKNAKTNAEASRDKKFIDKGAKSSTVVAKAREIQKTKEVLKTITYYWLFWFIPVGGVIYLIWKYKSCIWKYLKMI